MSWSFRYFSKCGPPSSPFLSPESHPLYHPPFEELTIEPPFCFISNEACQKFNSELFVQQNVYSTKCLRYEMFFSKTYFFFKCLLYTKCLPFQWNVCFMRCFSTNVALQKVCSTKYLIYKMFVLLNVCSTKCLFSEMLVLQNVCSIVCYT